MIPLLMVLCHIVLSVNSVNAISDTLQLLEGIRADMTDGLVKADLASTVERLRISLYHTLRLTTRFTDLVTATHYSLQIV